MFKEVKVKEAIMVTLIEAEAGKTYEVSGINTGDDEMRSFLFRLGCYEGELITLISKKRKGCVVVIKDGRYSFDNQLAEAVSLRNIAQ